MQIWHVLRQYDSFCFNLEIIAGSDKVKEVRTAIFSNAPLHPSGDEITPKPNIRVVFVLDNDIGVAVPRFRARPFDMRARLLEPHNALLQALIIITYQEICNGS
jgi:hypothetical protein